MENFAIHRIDIKGHLRTVVQSKNLRWPDGFSFGPGGWLYVTCSSLQHVLLKDEESILENSPYQVYKIKLQERGFPGH
jgi:hypothetical protein